MFKNKSPLRGGDKFLGWGFLYSLDGFRHDFVQYLQIDILQFFDVEASLAGGIFSKFFQQTRVFIKPPHDIKSEVLFSG